MPPPQEKYPHSMAGKPKCVLAYSGGLDTSVILVWLIEKVREPLECWEVL